MQGGAFSHHSPQGRTLGKYRLIARLGQGGMAEVFLAVVQGETGFNKLVVVKLLKPELMEEPEHKAMFLDEGRLAARLNHGNVVQTNEVQIVGDQYFIAMEYLDGQPLHRILRRAAKSPSPMPLGWHLHFLIEVLTALEYAHQLTDYDGTPLEMVHRDVTPHNVFVTYTGQVKLCDFGIAKTMTSSVETRTGVLKGKVNYMAPEQVLSNRIDRRADLFAVGIMLWEAVTGARMWQGQTDILIMQALSRGQVPRAREVNPKIDPELERIVNKALEPNPDDRYQTATEFRRDLENFLMSRTDRINPRRIGEWVMELFERERANLSRVIQEQLGSGADGSIAQLAPGVSPTGSTSAARDLGVHGSAGPPSHPPSRVASLTIPSAELRALRPNRTLAIALGSGAAVALFALVVVVAMLANRNEGGEVVAVQPTTPLTPTEASPLPTTPTAEPNAKQAAKVEVRIRVQPKETRLELDGKPLEENPFFANLPKDGREHVLRAEAPGHEPETRHLRLDRDVTLEFSLEKKSGGRVVAAPVHQPPGSKPGGNDAFPDLPGPKKKPTSTKPLDKDDPWK